VFEEQGVNGKKQVGLNGGKVMEVDDSQYKQMLDGRWHPPEQNAAILTMPNIPSSAPGTDAKNAAK
jgi:hypothetical protein